jgi:hypothetical protein
MIGISSKLINPKSSNMFMTLKNININIIENTFKNLPYLSNITNDYQGKYLRIDLST